MTPSFGIYEIDEDCENPVRYVVKNKIRKIVRFIIYTYICNKYNKKINNIQMGRVKESMLNNLTVEEIDSLYEELMLRDEFSVYEQYENEEGNIQDCPEGEG